MAIRFLLWVGVVYASNTETDRLTITSGVLGGSRSVYVNCTLSNASKYLTQLTLRDSNYTDVYVTNSRTRAETCNAGSTLASCTKFDEGTTLLTLLVEISEAQRCFVCVAKFFKEDTWQNNITECVPRKSADFSDDNGGCATILAFLVIFILLSCGLVAALIIWRFRKKMCALCHGQQIKGNEDEEQVDDDLLHEQDEDVNENQPHMNRIPLRNENAAVEEPLPPTVNLLQGSSVPETSQREDIGSNVREPGDGRDITPLENAQQETGSSTESLRVKNPSSTGSSGANSDRDDDSMTYPMTLNADSTSPDADVTHETELKEYLTHES